MPSRQPTNNPLTLATIFYLELIARAHCWSSLVFWQLGTPSCSLATALAQRLPNLLRKRLQIINGMQIGNSRLQLAYNLFQIIEFGLLLAFAVVTVGIGVGRWRFTLGA